MSIEDFKAAIDKSMKGKRPKYGNRCVIDEDGRFDSQAEHSRWGYLKLLARANEISKLERQVKYGLVVNGVPISTAIIDFRYIDKNGSIHLEDVKGFMDPASPATRLWQMKFKLIEALYGIKVEIIT